MRQLQITWWIKVNKYSCYAHNSTSGQMAKNEREKKTGIGYGTPGRALQLDDALRNFSVDGNHFRSIQEPLLWRVMLTPRHFVWQSPFFSYRPTSSVWSLELCSHSFSFIYVALKVRWASVYHIFFNPVTCVSVAVLTPSATAFFRSMTFVAIEWSTHLS